ncbi:MAG: class I SAM-dependent methyltransferase [Planctomycetia bacterium]|nr:class I SAM-dependent methyltransferase [Planctomycetia bacterium]
MIFDWTPGERISKLPKLLWWPALIWRNIYFLPHNVKHHIKQRESLAAAEIRKSLALSVTYIHGAGVLGEVAEFGTMTGRTATALAQAVAEYDGAKRLLLFDSFEGLPATQSVIDASSPHVRSGVWSCGTCRGVTSKQLLAMCRKYLPGSHIDIYDGWFSATLPTVPADTRFALLHIDSDLYQSAIDVLDYCFAHRMVSRGAAIHFDDWDCNQADPRYGERKAWAEIVDKFAVEFSDCGQYGWSARKFIVHSYRGMETNDS